MSVPDIPIPPEVFYDEGPPLSDEDLDRFFAAAEHLATEASRSFDWAADALATGPDDPSFPLAQQAARWQVSDDGTAAWAAAKLAEAEAQVAELAVRRDEWTERIGAWFDQASTRHRRTAAFMRGQLERYGLERRERTGEATLALPAATVRTTHRKARVEVADDDALADWLDGHRADFVERYWPDGVFDEEAWARLVRRSAKVLVSEARKVLRVAEVDDGWYVSVRLDCGHIDGWANPDKEMPEPPAEGTSSRCYECGSSGVLATVIGSLVERRTRPVVVGDYTGITERPPEPVPGATVRPAETTATVEVNT